MSAVYCYAMPQGEYLQYGGQAVVEGVMMRSPRFFAVACRAPNGEIIVQQEAIDKTWIGRQKWLKLPFLRGTFALLDAMSLGNKALKFAADVQVNPIYQPAEAVITATPVAGAVGNPEEFAQPIADVNVAAVPNPSSDLGTQAAVAKGEANRIQDATIGLTLVIGLVFGLFIFAYLPNLVAELVTGAKTAAHAATTNGMKTNLVAGLLKILFFIAYLVGIGQMEGIKEVFRYHGAEHKAINALEADQALTTDVCMLQTRLHPRCGTSFAIIVLLLSLVVFTFVPRYPLTGRPGSVITDTAVRLGIELCILPFIAGTAYELLRLAGKFRNQAIVSLLFKPGIWSQYITTREPAPKHVEVALVALRSVIDAEKAAT